MLCFVVTFIVAFAYRGPCELQLAMCVLPFAAMPVMTTCKLISLITSNALLCTYIHTGFRRFPVQPAGVRVHRGRCERSLPEPELRRRQVQLSAGKCMYMYGFVFYVCVCVVCGV